MTNEEKIKLLRDALTIRHSWEPLFVNKDHMQNFATVRKIVNDALAATSPAQPEPAQRDERADFIEWFREQWPEILLVYEKQLPVPMLEESINAVNSSWLGWQARAALINGNDLPAIRSKHFAFNATGDARIDKILLAVAKAGRAYHHTNDWNEECRDIGNDYGLEGDTPVEWIQNAANEAIRATSEEGEMLAAYAKMVEEESEFCPDYDSKTGKWGIPYLVNNDGGFGGGVGLQTFNSFEDAIRAAISAKGEGK